MEKLYAAFLLHLQLDKTGELLRLNCWSHKGNNARWDVKETTLSVVREKIMMVVKTTRDSTEKKQRFTADMICVSNFVEMFPIHGMCSMECEMTRHVHGMWNDQTALTSNIERRATFPSSKQRNLPICVPLWQSVRWSHVSALRRANQTTHPKIDYQFSHSTHPSKPSPP